MDGVGHVDFKTAPSLLFCSHFILTLAGRKVGSGVLVPYLVRHALRSFVLFVLRERVTEPLPHARHTRAGAGEEGNTGMGRRRSPKGSRPFWNVPPGSGVKVRHWAEGVTVSRDRSQRDTGGGSNAGQEGGGNVLQIS